MCNEQHFLSFETVADGSEPPSIQFIIRRPPLPV